MFDMVIALSKPGGMTGSHDQPLPTLLKVYEPRFDDSSSPLSFTVVGISSSADSSDESAAATSFFSGARARLALRLRFLPTRPLPSVAGISPSRAARVIVANVDPSPHPPTVTAASAPHATTHAAPIIFVTRPRPWVLGTLARSPLARSADSSSVIAAGVGIVDARPSSSTVVGINRRRARGGRWREDVDRTTDRVASASPGTRGESRLRELPHTIMCSVSGSEIT